MTGPGGAGSPAPGDELVSVLFIPGGRIGVGSFYPENGTDINFPPPGVSAPLAHGNLERLSE